MELATLDCAHWFNRKRLPGPIGDMPRVAVEARYCERQANLAEAT